MIPFTPPALPVPMPPVKPIHKRMGIRMGGCEKPLEEIISQHIKAIKQAGVNRPYTLVEIGSAGCVTLRAFKDIITENAGDHPWRVFGFDLTEEKAWSLDWDEIHKAFDGTPHILREQHLTEGEGLVSYPDNQMYLVLLDSPRLYIQDAFPFPIDFVFIDGSHGRSCALDFLAIEKKMAEGGVVVFHDYGEAETGTDWQTVDREFINVRTYVHRLGLASPCNEVRKGWRFVGEIKGSRTRGGDGNSAAVVQRTGEPLVEQPELSLERVII